MICLGSGSCSSKAKPLPGGSQARAFHPQAPLGVISLRECRKRTKAGEKRDQRHRELVCLLWRVLLSSCLAFAFSCLPVILEPPLSPSKHTAHDSSCLSSASCSSQEFLSFLLQTLFVLFIFTKQNRKKGRKSVELQNITVRDQHTLIYSTWLSEKSLLELQNQGQTVPQSVHEAMSATSSCC